MGGTKTFWVQDSLRCGLSALADGSMHHPVCQLHAFLSGDIPEVAELLADRDRMATVVMSGKQLHARDADPDRSGSRRGPASCVSALETAHAYGQMLRDAEDALRPELPGSFAMKASAMDGAEIEVRAAL
jgi:hypothetical protein